MLPIYILSLSAIILLGIGIAKKIPLKTLWLAEKNAIKTTSGILIAMLLIGVLTGIWRSSGTISYLVVEASSFISGSYFILATFIANAIISFLTGSSFGTAATMGIITMTMGASMGIPAIWTGGAIMSGIYFGDRASPVSTTLLLISNITNTDFFY